MENLSETEKLIMSYLESNPPEECMLDKITRGINRSRATVLKYLHILEARGLVTYRMVGRSKLWMPTRDADVKTVEYRDDTSRALEIIKNASEIHETLLRLLELERKIDDPDKLVFTVNTLLDIVVANESFRRMFPGARNLEDIMDRESIILLESRMHAPGKIQADLRGRDGIRRTYSLFISPVNNFWVIIAKDMASSSFSKNELEVLLTITRLRTSSDSLEDFLGSAREELAGVLDIKQISVVLRDASGLNRVYDHPSAIKLEEFDYFIYRSIETLETVSWNSDKGLMLSIPLITEERARGAMILEVPDDSISSRALEIVEMFADEVSEYIELERLRRENEEFIRTLLAMNRVSEIINSDEEENRILEKSIEAVIDTLEFEMGCIYLMEEERELKLRVQKNLPETLSRMCMAGVFTDLFSRSIEDERVIYITAESPEYRMIHDSIRKNNIRTILMIPIRFSGEIIGILNLASYSVKPYNRISLENISSIGLQLGSAIRKIKG
ncbi:GAF domain-containing protein [Methanothermobacter sp. DP]|uniref:GAF domain-containing protein n=1 Tax=Methanothermobacter sp. DP TaxID=2998972 RepID=UPI002AA50DCD|nr:GAF domain-containing protein [Methanothermobacter sp. DP]